MTKRKNLVVNILCGNTPCILDTDLFLASKGSKPKEYAFINETLNSDDGTRCMYDCLCYKTLEH